MRVIANAVCVLALFVSTSACREDKTAKSATTNTWTFDSFSRAFENQVAVVYSRDRVGLLAPDGRLLATFDTGSNVDDVQVVDNAKIALVAITETKGGGPLHAIDKASGETIWSLKLPVAFVSQGESTVGIATSSDFTIRSLDTGREVYRLPTTALGLRMARKEGYVLRETGQLRLIEETGKERWRQPVDALKDAEIDFENGSLYVLRPDRTFEQRSFRDGSLVSKGTCEGEPSKSGKTTNCDGKPTSTKEGHPRALQSRSARGQLGDKEGKYEYYLRWNQGPKLLVANDRVGRQRWRSQWPPIEADLEKDTIHHNSLERTVGFVAGRDSLRALLVYDDDTGKLLINRPLENQDKVVGIAGSCWLIVTRRAVACLNARTGADVWTVQTTGSAVEAWPLPDEQALIADGNPLRLSRIDRGGRPQWQLELTDTELTSFGLHPTTNPASPLSAWQFSDVMGVVETKAGLGVIDLRTGKRTLLK